MPDLEPGTSFSGPKGWGEVAGTSPATTEEAGQPAQRIGTTATAL